VNRHALRSLSAEPSCNPYAGITGGDYQGLRLYARSLCAAYAGSCLVPGTYTRNCSSFASQPVTEKLNVVAVHAQAQHLLPRLRTPGAEAAAAFVAGGNESVLFSPTQTLQWRKEYAGGVVDGEVMSIASAGPTLMIGTNNSFSFTSDDGAFHRVGACVSRHLHIIRLHLLSPLHLAPASPAICISCACISRRKHPPAC
jgi:hypothetical protein